MVVIADTSPIHYLVLIGKIQLLPKLYGRILVPPAVLAELRHTSAPEMVREWVTDPPAWMEIRQPTHEVPGDTLDRGEAEAISLAQELGADVLLIDDWAGRREATRRGLHVAGTVAVLDQPDRAGLADFADAVARLHQTPFRLSDAVLVEIRRRRS